MAKTILITVLMPDRADALRRALIGLGTAAGLIAALYIFSSQAAADFLREGPARQLAADGDALRVALAGGAGIATIVAAALLWRSITVVTVVAAGVALLAGFLLVHILLMPAIALFGLAVITDRSGHITRERLAEVGPRRYPLLWVAGGVLAVADIAMMTAVTLYLAEPLFDEGKRLDERLGFQVAGVMQPTVMPAGPEATSCSSHVGC